MAYDPIKAAEQMEVWKAKEAAGKFAAEQLRIAHPHLVGGEGHVIAAKNIRIELKRAFPGVKFGVKGKSYSGGDSITVSWTDGPMAKQVEAIVTRYDGGSFDGMTDSYNYRDERAWGDAFGSAKYTFCNRQFSERMIGSVMARVCKRLGGLETLPTVEDYQQGRLWNVKTSGGCDVSREVNIALSKHTYCLTQGA